MSQRIKKLEKYLGVKLYESRGGRVRLTEAGQRTTDFAMRLFDEITEFEEAIGDEDSQGTVVLNAEVPLLRFQLANIVDSYAHAHAPARLRLLGRTAVETIELVRRNEADLEIVHDRSMPPGVKFHAWRVFKSYVLIPRDHALARRKIPTLQDILKEEVLQRYPLIVGEIEEHGQNRIREGLEQLGLPYNVGLEVGNIETVKHYVARGHGLAAVSGVCLSREDEAIFHIIEIPEALQGETTYGVILRDDKHLASSLRGLLDLFELPDICSRGQK